MTTGEMTATNSKSDDASSSSSPRPVSVLFVCLGNICRSTMSEGVFQSITRQANSCDHPLVTRIDSCGTGAYHVGDGPDPRTMATLKAHGITNYHHKARKFRNPKDFADFDYIFAMDDDNLRNLQQLRAREVKRLGGEEGVGKVMLFGEFGGKKRKNGRGEEIMDPYYGDADGFDVAYEQAVRFSKAFLGELEGGRLD